MPGIRMARLGRLHESVPFFHFLSSRKIGLLLYILSHLLDPGLHLLTEFDRKLDSMTSSLPFQDERDTFDFVIVGGGSSGSSLASRLSSEGFSILVLDAGGTPSLVHSLPVYSYAQTADLDINWQYKTVPQKNACFGLNNNVSHWPAGKILGGSSILNAMIYLRGNVQGFDEIAEKTGDERWKLSNVLKYYRNLENYHGWFETNGQHGTNGPLNVERTGTQPFTDNFLEAGEELGYLVRDPNPFGPYTEGFAKMDLYMKRGRRSDAYHEFLLPAMRKSRDLVVRKFSHVTQVLFTGNNEASGVEYERHGQRLVAKAKLEVILSSGSIRSPQLLILSGIGPKEHLEDLGISQRVNLPVGQYLQDKYGVYLGPFLVDKGQSVVYERDMRVIDLIPWFLSGTGPLRTALGEGSWALLTESAKRDNRTLKPDIHTYILSTTAPIELRNVLASGFNFKPEILDYFSKAAKTDSFIQLVSLNAPVGHGTLKLRDRNPFSFPIIDPKYLEREQDVRALIEGVKMAVKLVEETQAMRKIGGSLMPVKLPGCEGFEWKSDEYFECVIRHVTITAFKYAGTAPIGKDFSDPYAVVDSHLRVLGTKRLRVVDGSVLQQRHTSINDVTCRMLGQLAGDIIIEDYFIDNRDP